MINICYGWFVFSHGKSCKAFKHIILFSALCLWKPDKYILPLEKILITFPMVLISVGIHYTNLNWLWGRVLVSFTFALGSLWCGSSLHGSLQMPSSAMLIDNWVSARSDISREFPLWEASIEIRTGFTCYSHYDDDCYIRHS